jgi:Uma2 family endonuclease
MAIVPVVDRETEKLEAKSTTQTNGLATRPTPETPPLQPGDFLTRPEFERRYQLHPQIKKAELIEGVVYMPSPVRARLHGDPHFTVASWLGVYQASTPGVRGSDNVTLRLDLLNEPQPDILLRFEPSRGGKCAIDIDGYLVGAPELIVEIAASSASYDMNQKKAVYARHGVQEYLVVQMHEQLVSWFALRDGIYQPLQPNEDGVLRSEVFPGLHLQPAAIWDNDLARLLATLQQGLASPEHQAFVAGQLFTSS